MPTASADDAAQQVFLVAARRIDDIADGSERSFLLSTARGVAAIAAGETILAELGLNETRAVAADGVLRGVMLAPNEGARHLVVIFGADDGGFVVPLALAGPKRQHLLFVQDRQHCLALLGVANLAEALAAAFTPPAAPP